MQLPGLGFVSRLAIVAGAAFALILTHALTSSPASAQSAAALAGQVASTEEGPMEGVIVSAKKDGSTITVSVLSNAQGRYSFPAARPRAPRSRRGSPPPPISSCARPAT